MTLSSGCSADRSDHLGRTHDGLFYRPAVLTGAGPVRTAPCPPRRHRTSRVSPAAAAVPAGAEIIVTRFWSARSKAANKS